MAITGPHDHPFDPKNPGCKVAILTLSGKGLLAARTLKKTHPEWEILLHEDVDAGDTPVCTFSRVIAETKRVFTAYQGLVYIMPTGVVVRAVGPLVESKLKDPAVIVCDVAARHCVSLLSGHEGGANALCMEVSNLLDSEPVISTTTEAEKTVIAGIGCRRGTAKAAIFAALDEALETTGLSRDALRLMATADVKRNETGLVEAAEALGIPLRIIPSDTIRTFGHSFRQSDFVQQNVNLPAVAEPSAMLAGRRTRLICKTLKKNGVTVALAEESSLWSASAPETPEDGRWTPSRR